MAVPGHLAAVLRRLGIQDWSDDPDYNLALTGIGEQAALQQQQDDILRGRLGEDYKTSQQRMTQDRDRQIREVSAQMAARGLGRSGINLAQQAQVGMQYQRRFGDLGRDYTRGVQDLDVGATGRERGYGVQIAQQARARTLRQEENKRQQAEAAARAAALRQLGIM